MRYDEIRYKELLDGLEVSEIPLSELERTHRIDSEFYRKQFIEDYEILENVDNVTFSKVMEISDGNHMSISNDFCEEGVPYYRGQDIYSFFIENANSVKITREAFERGIMKRSHLQRGDVLVSIVGAIIGNSSLVYKDIEATCSCKLAILRPKGILPEVLATYIKSRYAQSQIQRYRRGGAQTGLIVEDIGTLKIPAFSIGLQNCVKEYIDKMYLLIEKSVSLMSNAENIMLRNFEMDTTLYDDSKYVEKSFSSSFGTTARLDAEYYQKKYDNLFEQINRYSTRRLEELVDIKKSVEPGSEFYINEGVSFVRVSDVTKYGISEPSIKLAKSTIKNLDFFYSKKDTILLSKDGSVGIAYKLEQDANFVTSGALLHLSVKSSEILPDYLTLVLNSEIVRLQAERDSGGSIIQHWKPSEIEKVIIPILDITIQKQLSNDIRKSFECRKLAKNMLDKAVRIVEIAIEQGEEKALYFKKNEVCE